MTTSGTTAWSMTAGDIIQTALERGVLALGETPDPAETTACITRLNGLLKSWQMDGLLWKQETISVSTTAATATISLPSYVRDVNGARYVESATNERPMVPWERDEYYMLPNKASAGASTCYYVQRATDGLTLHIWPVPAAVATIKLDIDRKLDTVTVDTETVDIPEELQETLYNNLALACWDIFKDIPPSQELLSRVAHLNRLASDSYRPASYLMSAG